jgi:diguanylate cyclase (GGDEF)-like protein
LRQRLTAASVLLVLLTCALVTGWSLHLAEREMLTTIGTQQFDLLSSASAYLDADIAQKQALLRTVVDAVDGRQPGACNRARGNIERYAVLRDEFANVVAYDETGRMIGNLRDRSRIGTPGFRDRPYFVETMRSRQGVISAPFTSKLSSRPLILITEPIFDQAGRLVCLLAGSIDLAQPAFFGQITRLKPGKTGFLFALTRDGLILHHPDQRRLLKNVLTEPGGAIPSTKAAMRGWEGWVLARAKSGTPAIITYKRMRNPGWILGSVYPLDEAFHSVSVARRAAIVGAVVVAVCAGLAGWFLMKALLHPLQRLRSSVVAVEEGRASSEVFNLDRRDEVGALARALHSFAAKREAAEARLAHLALTDVLTGLGNRRCLYMAFGDIAARARRARMGVALAFLDIDHFKAINDRLGHDVGDLVLKEFAARLLGAVRQTDHVYRLAGDEFVVVFEQVADGGGLDAIAAKIGDHVRHPFLVAEPALQVTTSIGIAVCGWEDAEIDTLLRRADAALYQTKQRGRNGFTLSA